MHNRIILITVIAGLLAFVSVPAFGQGAAAVTDVAAIAQRGANHAENLSKWADEIAQWGEQLNTMLESNDWIQKAYSAAQFVGLSSQTTEIISTIDSYKSLVQLCVSDINNYSENGLLSASQVAYSFGLISQGLSGLTGLTFSNVKDALSANGMSVKERMSILVGFNDELRQKYLDLLRLKNQNASAAAAAQRAINAEQVSILAGLSPVATLNVDGCADAVLSDSYTSSLCASGKSLYSHYYSGSAEAQTEKATSNAKGLYGNAVDIASYLLGIAAALLLVIAFERRNKGERQSTDALYKIGIGFLFALVALQVVTRYFDF